MEEWRDIEGYNGFYQVSNKGNVRNGETLHILTPSFCKDGYLKVKLRHGKERTIQVHRLVAAAFCDNSCGKAQVNHKNGIKTDNRSENLEWVTPGENVQHAIKTGLWNPVFNTDGKPVIGFERNGDGTIHFASIHAAARATGIHYANIGAACNGRLKSCGGYFWFFTGEKVG